MKWTLRCVRAGELNDSFGPLLKHRYDTASTVFCTQYAKKDWHQRLGSGVHADAIMDRIVHDAIWVDTGSRNMSERATLNQ